MAADEVVHRGTGALVGHVLEVDPGALAEKQGGDVAGRGVAGRAVDELLRLGLLEELGQRLHREPRADDDDELGVGDHRDRVERLGRVMAHLEDVRVDHHRPLVADEQRVAVGIGLGDHFGSHVAGGARSVVDDDAAAELLLELGGEAAGDGVGAAARGVGDDEGDGLRRIVVVAQSPAGPPARWRRRRAPAGCGG